MIEIIIRSAKKNDANSITRLSHQLGYETLEETLQNRLINIIENRDNCVYVACINENIVGWIHGFYSMRVESEFFVEIGGLVIEKRFRKIGIGKKLVEKVTEWAELKNCRKVRVRCNLLRTESHEFYQKIGFEMNKIQKIFDKKLSY
ncbi:MAG TPA: GNAT family N-acetyltransferase [Saprospiraceae bacterium]|nr:GNAT family N-acetyltransferase [Saprospiraceae bacterium]HRX28087.1 GNAT family N-acetyltransferase [Saprospiraceae bacterium]